MSELRDYQRDLVARAEAELAERSAVLQLPTGGGKTRVAVEVARRRRARGGRVWFVCHRREIVAQTAASFAEAGVLHSVAGGPGRPGRASGVQICSVNALARCIERWPAPDLVIWDECQHVPAPTWSGAKDRLRGARHLGLTATPARLDGAGLRSAFDAMICGPDTRALIDRGFLSPFRLFAPTIPDLRGVGVRMGDYARGDAEREMGRPVVVGDVIDHYRRLAPGARAIAFCVSIRASEALAQRFNEAGIPARHVDGKTPTAKRDAAVAALRSGEVRVLCNVELFTEGFDAPAVEAVILLRPTKSLALYRQMVGRALRTAPGKGVTTILDHAGLVHEHGMPDDEVEWSLEGYRRPAPRAGEGDGAPRLRRCPECTALHAWATECVECGHAYRPADRSVEEVYGELRPVGGRAAPPGCELQKDFAVRVGLSRSKVSSLIKDGLPNVEGCPLVQEGVAWIAGRRIFRHRRVESSDERFENMSAFSRRVGISTSHVERLAQRGLPRVATGPHSGLIEVATGLAWIDRWRKAREKRSRPMRAEKVSPAFLGETFREFQNRTGVTAGKDALRRAGLPLHSDGTVDGVRADEWLRTARLSKQPLYAGQEAVATFCRRIGRWPRGNSRQSLLDAGLPLVNGMVPIDRTLAWARERGLIKDAALLARLDAEAAERAA